MSYPTQEDELRAKEGHAEAIKAAEEARFLSIFQTIPTKNVGRLSELAYKITDNFNSVMQEARQESFERQEDLMMGMKKLIEEEIRVIEARRTYSKKINPSTTASVEEKA